MIVLTSVLISCRTTKIKEVVIVPELYFPDFPKPDKLTPLDKDLQLVTDEETEIVYIQMSFEYFKRIVEYKAQIDETKAKYKVYKDAM